MGAVETLEMTASDIFGIQKAYLHERKSSKSSNKEQGSPEVTKHGDLDGTGNTTHVRGVSEM